MRLRYWLCGLFAILLIDVRYGFTQNIPNYVFTGGSAVVGRGVWQTDLGFNASRTNLKDTSAYRNQFGQYINLKYGVNAKSHVNVNYNYSTSLSYVSDVIKKNNVANSLNIGYIYSVWSKISLQAVLGANDPFDDINNFNLQIQGIAEHPIGNRITWQNNFGVSSAMGSWSPSVNYLSGITYTFPKPFDLIFELYGNMSESMQSHFGNFGFGYYFSKNFRMW